MDRKHGDESIQRGKTKQKPTVLIFSHSPNMHSRPARPNSTSTNQDQDIFNPSSPQAKPSNFIVFTPKERDLHPALQDGKRSTRTVQLPSLSFLFHKIDSRRKSVYMISTSPGCTYSHNAWMLPFCFPPGESDGDGDGDAFSMR